MVHECICSTIRVIYFKSYSKHGCDQAFKILGKKPIVVVEVNKVPLVKLKTRFQCQGGMLLSLLDTISLSSIVVIDRMCQKCVNINFSKASDGTTLVGGMNISKQWQPDGVTINAISTLPLTTKARILDTGDKRCIQTARAQEFGSPNESCPGGGIGEGSGGAVGTDGENCDALGSKYYYLTIYNFILTFLTHATTF
jgi:hypothetical protein